MSTAHPKIVSREDWLTARQAHLAHEKELTKAGDRLHAERRRLPMVKLDKTYTFDGPTGHVTLAELFADKRQLIVYHFMFDPAWDKGCPGCTGFIDALGDLSLLDKKDTAFVAISRAPLAKLQAYRKERDWDIEWYSSNASDFNDDLEVTTEKGERHALSVFFKLGDEVFHTYQAFARGCENVTNAYALLDITPYGRQQSFEDSPPGWPQNPTYG